MAPSDRHSPDPDQAQESAPPRSEKDRKWREWTDRKFGSRPYLAIQAEEKRAEAVMLLTLTQRGRGIPDPSGAVVLSALDGSAEFSRVCAECHHYNGADGIVEARDADFYRRAARPLADHGGTLVQHGAARTDTPSPADRLFQDACAAVFPDTSLVAVAAAFDLHRRLAEYNARGPVPWEEQLHARVVIAGSWERAMPCLRNTWRGQTVIEGEIWDALDDDLLYVLFAAGVRRGGEKVLPAATQQLVAESRQEARAEKS